ncbi:MAG TPA: glycosyltransferase [Candidatus Limnocylindria bacterium]|nr:glycosyltransferase [Candidatus Limnocylindria bacterium]
MKILVLTKRRYMGKDLLDDRFGRFRELPLELARLGHQVRGLCLSYRPRNEVRVIDATATRDGQVPWQSVNLTRGILPSLPAYFRQARRSIGEFQPDLIWACSDAYHAIFGHRLAREFRCRLAIDLYDNFEAFSATKLPGVMFMFRRSVRKADGVTFFSQPMAAHVIKTYPMTSPHTVILSGVRKDLFYPQDRNSCRKDLKLPAAAKIIGVAGALDSSRDIDTLFSAFATLAEEMPNLHLALAGARSSKQKIPRGPKIHDFQSLPHERVPLFLNALDLAVVSYRRSAQGKYSFPQKAYEIIACGVPLVAAAVGSMNELLRDYPNCLYEPEDAISLARAIRLQLEAKTAAQIIAPSWADSAAQLSRFFEKIAAPQLAKTERVNFSSAF